MGPTPTPLAVLPDTLHDATPPPTSTGSTTETGNGDMLRKRKRQLQHDEDDAEETPISESKASSVIQNHLLERQDRRARPTKSLVPTYSDEVMQVLAHPLSTSTGKKRKTNGASSSSPPRPAARPHSDASVRASAATEPASGATRNPPSSSESSSSDEEPSRPGHSAARGKDPAPVAESAEPVTKTRKPRKDKGVPKPRKKNNQEESAPAEPTTKRPESGKAKAPRVSRKTTEELLQETSVTVSPVLDQSSLYASLCAHVKESMCTMREKPIPLDESYARQRTLARH